MIWLCTRMILHLAKYAVHPAAQQHQAHHQYSMPSPVKRYHRQHHFFIYLYPACSTVGYSPLWHGMHAKCAVQLHSNTKHITYTACPAPSKKVLSSILLFYVSASSMQYWHVCNAYAIPAVHPFIQYMHVASPPPARSQVSITFLDAAQ